MDYRKCITVCTAHCTAHHIQIHRQNEKKPNWTQTDKRHRECKKKRQNVEFRLQYRSAYVLNWRHICTCAQSNDTYSHIHYIFVWTWCTSLAIKRQKQLEPSTYIVQAIERIDRQPLNPYENAEQLFHPNCCSQISFGVLWQFRMRNIRLSRTKLKSNLFLVINHIE